MSKRNKFIEAHLAVEGKMVCPKCNGKKVVVDKFLAVCTIGMSWLMGDNEPCPTCKGRGYVQF